MAEAVSPPLEEKGKSESKDGVASGGAAAVLGIAKSEVDELLSECGEAAGRALLGLIYRFSAMESELNDLRSMIEGGATMTVHQSFAAPLPPAKSSTVLEQVFQSNLALWASIDQ